VIRGTVREVAVVAESQYRLWLGKEGVFPVDVWNTVVRAYEDLWVQVEDPTRAASADSFALIL
jgi:hypothetical protein